MDTIQITQAALPPGFIPPVEPTPVADGKWEGQRHLLHDGRIALDFYERHGRRTHCYLLDGVRISGVTTILRILNKPQLIYWACNEMEADLLARMLPAKPESETLPEDYDIGDLGPPPLPFEQRQVSYTVAELQALITEAKSAHTRKRDAAGDVGTAAHDRISRYIKSVIAAEHGNGKRGACFDILLATPPVLTDFDLQVQQACEGFYSWESNHKVRWLSTERVIYCQLELPGGLVIRYCGTMDFEAIVDGKFVCGDLKTAKGIYDEFYFQTAGYMQAREHEHDGLHYDDRLILRLNKEGTKDGALPFEAHWLAGRDGFEADRLAFNAAACIHERLDALKGGGK